MPAGTRSLALLCHDPDVPSRGDDVNKEGRIVPASLPRVDFFHWVLDRPAAGRRVAIARGAHSDGVTPRGKAGPHAPREGRHGINDYTAGSPATTTWPATTTATTARARRGTTRSRIATCSRCTRSTLRGSRCRASSPAPTCARAMDGHVLAQASVTGRYTLNPAVTL